MPKYYIFRYSPKLSKVIQNTIPPDEKPSQIHVSSVKGNWIDAANIDYSAYGYNDKMDLSQQGKWVIKFSSGNENLDDAWDKVINGIKTDKLWTAKISPKSENFSEQVICVYTPNWRNAAEIREIYHSLLKLGIQPQDIAGYKRDEETKNNQDQYIYDSECQKTEFLNGLLASSNKSSFHAQPNSKTPLLTATQENEDEENQSKISCCRCM